MFATSDVLNVWMVQKIILRSAQTIYFLDPIIFLALFQLKEVTHITFESE